MIVHNRVRRRQMQPGGSVVQRQLVYASLMDFAKHAGRWLRIANVSTFEPD